MQETQVQPLGWENTLENEMATHSSILAWGLSAGMFVSGITIQMRLNTILDLGIQKLRTVIVH